MSLPRHNVTLKPSPMSQPEREPPLEAVPHGAPVLKAAPPQLKAPPPVRAQGQLLRVEDEAGALIYRQPLFLPQARREGFCAACNCVDCLAKFASWVCSKFCWWCFLARRPQSRCDLGCEHPECRGVYGDPAWCCVYCFPPRQANPPRHTGNRCILADGHSGRCLCEAHAPPVQCDCALYRPLVGPP